MDGHLRRGASSLIDNLHCCVLLSVCLVTNMMTSSLPISPIYHNVWKVSQGLTTASLLTYFQDFNRLLSSSEYEGPRYLSTLHLGLAALHLQLSPPDSRNKYYVTYWAIISLRPLLLKLVQKFPQSFSYGEAALVSQAFLLSLVAAVMSLLSLDKISTRALALELANNLKTLEEKFLTVESTLVNLLTLWAGLVLVSVAVVGLYHARGWQVTTSTRKIFHLAIVLVFLSGLAWSPLLLLLASYGLLVVMVGLETIRVSRLFPPVSDFLTARLRRFTDEKDSGSLILTNIYLLAGMSLPLWLDPGLTLSSPHHSQPAHFSLYCGLLAVGVFDTVAAVVGSSLGRTRWRQSSGRTLEGSLAGLFATITAVFLLWRLVGVSLPSTANILISAGLVMLVEALSCQVDNLSLPLVMLISTNVCSIIGV